MVNDFDWNVFDLFVSRCESANVISRLIASSAKEIILEVRESLVSTEIYFSNHFSRHSQLQIPFKTPTNYLGTL